MSGGNQRWAWVAAIIAVLVIGGLWLRGDDDGSDGGSQDAQAAALPAKTAGAPAGGHLVCDLVPKDDVADAYDVDADGLRETFAHPTSSREGVSCDVVQGVAA